MLELPLRGRPHIVWVRASGVGLILQTLVRANGTGFYPNPYSGCRSVPGVGLEPYKNLVFGRASGGNISPAQSSGYHSVVTLAKVL